MSSVNSRVRSQNYRRSPEGKLARKMHNALPEVKLRKAIHRKMRAKLHPTKR
jgi:hypothetical protein